MQRTRDELFGVLVREHQTGLLAFVRACVHDRADADDLVQDTFAAAWQRLDEYDRNQPFAAWLRGIGRHKIAEYFRGRAASRVREHVLPPEAVTAIADEFERLNRPARGEVYRDCFVALEECLGTLPPVDGEIVRRAYRRQETCRTIAADLNLTLEAIKKRLQRARAALRDCIVGKLGVEEVPYA